MKTSNKIILLAVVILLGLLFSYDLALQASFKKANYKDPFFNYSKLKYSNFDKVIVKAANQLKVEIRQSDTFAVRVSNFIKDNVEIGRVGDQLLVSLTDRTDSYVAYEKGVVIFMPRLREVIATDFKRMKEDGKGKVQLEADWREGNYTLVSGFDLNSLKINQVDNSMVILQNNRIGKLQSVEANGTHQSELRIEGSNRIDSAHISVKGTNILNLFWVDIPHLKYDLSEGATISLTGGALKLMKK